MTTYIYAGRRLGARGSLLHVYFTPDDLNGRAHAFRKSLAPAIIGRSVEVEESDDGASVTVKGPSTYQASDELRRSWAADEATELANHAQSREAKRLAADSRDLDDMTLGELRRLYMSKRTRSDRAGLAAWVLTLLQTP